MTSQAEPDLTDDRLLGGRIRFQQPRRGYRVAIDPILLAASVAVADNDRVLDAGTGTAAAALCLASRLRSCHVIGLERDPELLAIGRYNIAGNALTDRVELLEGDLLDPPAGLRATSFDVVMTNPPYHPCATVSAPATPTRRAAHLANVDLPAWIAACLARLRPLGRLFMIHPPDRLDTILGALAGSAGDVVVLPLWPRVDDSAAKRVIIRARKCGRGPVRLARRL